MSDDTCAEKHRKWLVTIVAIVLTLCSGTLGICYTMVSSLEVRVRSVEQSDAANAARFEAIRESLRRLEGRAAP